MNHKRRGIFLVEMLTVIFMVGIGGTLMSVGLASLMRSQDRVVAFGNQLARVHDFLGALERDVRAASTAALGDVQGEQPCQVLSLGELPTQVTYRFFENRVERTADATAIVWSPLIAQIHLERGMAGRVGVGADVSIHRANKSDPEPHRRFQLFVRCAGAIHEGK
jgi:hypothetical protein